MSKSAEKARQKFKGKRRPANPAKPLTPKQRLFVDYYLKSGNAKESAQKAGYKERMGERLLDGNRNPHIVAAIVAGRNELRKEAKLEARQLVEELANIAFFDPLDLIDEKGNLKDLRDMPAHARRAIKEIRLTQRLGVGVDGKPLKVRVAEVKTWDKLAALEQLAKHLGLFGKETPKNVNLIDWTSLFLQKPSLIPNAAPAQIETNGVDRVERRLAEVELSLQAKVKEPPVGLPPPTIQVAPGQHLSLPQEVDERDR